jgi:solute carrier family 25 protein 42
MITRSSVVATSTHGEHAKESPPSPPEESLLAHFLASSSSLQLSNTLICGALAGVAAKTVIAPLERIKMSFQVSTERFTLRAAIQRGILTVRKEGFLSLWKGHSTTVLRVAPYAALSYTFHDMAELFFRKITDSQHTSLPGYLKFAAGSIGGLAGTLLTYPLDVLRVRIALGGSWKSSLQHGGLFHGLLPTLLGIAPYAGTAWLVKQTLLEAYTLYHPQHPPSIPESLVINATAGLMGQFVTYPLDILRRRMQIARPIEVVQMINIVGAQHVDSKATREYAGPAIASSSSTTTTPSAASAVASSTKGKYLSMTEMFKRLWKEEGIRGLGKGFSVNIIKGPISLSVSLTVYDWLRSHIFADEKQSKNRPRSSTATASTVPHSGSTTSNDSKAASSNSNSSNSSSNSTSAMTETGGRRRTMVGGASFLTTTAEELSNRTKQAKKVEP